MVTTTSETTSASRAGFRELLAECMRLQERLTRVQLRGDPDAYTLAEADLLDAERRFFRLYAPRP